MTPTIIIFLVGLMIASGQGRVLSASLSAQSRQSPLERDLAVGEIHSYRVMLTAGQYMRAVCDQRGIDVVVTLLSPGNQRLMEIDNPIGDWGLEPLFYEVKTGGYYTIQVQPRRATAPPGRYRFSFEARQPTPEDQKRLPAERAFAEGTGLLQGTTPRSFQRGMEKYEEARRLFRAVNDRPGEIMALVQIASINASLGDAQKALSYFDEALPLVQAEGNRAQEAMTLSNLAKVYQSLGERERALDYFNRALRLFRAVGDNRTAGYTLVNIGTVEDAMGENQVALDIFHRALPQFQAAHDRRGEAYTLNNIGLVYDALGDKQKAREAYDQALALFRGISDCGEVAPTLSNLALDLFNSGDQLKALEYLDQALALQRSYNDRKGEAKTLNNIGFIYSSLSQTKKALDYLQQALAIHREVRNREGEGDSLSNLMLTWKSQSMPPVAVFYGKNAVNAYQEVRATIPPLDKEAQKSFLKSKELTYRELADLLIERGRVLEAQQVLGLLKEEEYFQFVRRDGKEAANSAAPAALTPEEQDLADRYREVSDQIATLGRERSALLGKANRTPGEQRRLLKLEADLNVANLTFQKFIEGISTELTVAKQSTQRAEQVKDPQHIVNILRELGAGAVAIYTFVGEQKYSVILVTPDVQIAREYPIKAGDLYKKVLAFREILEDPRRDPRPLAQELYRILIGPIANDLRDAHAETLMWSLDGILRYIPVTALYDGEQYMAERFRNAVFTPISTTRLTDQPSAKWETLGYGVSKAQPGFEQLEEVPKELRSIIREGSTEHAGDGVLPGRIRLDEAFTRAELDAGLQQKFAVVHIASHFQFEPGNETKSFLLLGDGTHLTLDQLRSSPDYFHGVELLTLSACNTATGGTGSDGKEVEGFAVLAQHQGAEAVIASLWPVADASTRLLMQKFYQIRSSRPGMLKAEALRQAQTALIRGEVKGPDGKDYSHPYFWAPFILIGNWR
jgi:CHAT domain-containing protein/Tfp pilus assembly protein PilF